MRRLGQATFCLAAIGALQDVRGSSTAPDGPCGLDQLHLPYCDPTLPQEERINDLISRLAIDEKIGLLINAADEVPSQGLPAYEWWNEALHGVGHSPGVTFQGSTPIATSFPQVVTTSHAFNVDLVQSIASAISSEARVFNNKGHAGLTYWAPNINIFRDPRWGRGQETPGEDPLYNGAYAAYFVRGMQEGEDSRYLKTSACCKHFAAYSVETLYNGTHRHNFDAQVTPQDMSDSYLPAFKSCITKGRASSLMCSYNAINGVPACADAELMNGLARGTWKFDGYITSDCGAIKDILTRHQYTTTPEDTCQVALRAGCDLDCSDFYKTYIPSAILANKVTEEDLNVALQNLLKVQFRLGMFDPKEDQVYTKYDLRYLNSADHQALAAEAARQGMVLLKNLKETLPLDHSRALSIALVGPHANATDAMQGNYFGDPPFIITPYDGIRSYVKGVTLAPGCEINGTDKIAFIAAQQAAAAADVTILVLGLNRSIEDEGRDRTSILLPDPQVDLTKAILKASNNPVIVVLISGGAVDISFLKDDRRVDAIIFAGYPGQAGGQAIAEVIFGDVNPSGRLTQTFYESEFLEQAGQGDMRMRPDPESGYPGRTYRFLDGPVVYPFGYGLSYTNFSVKAIPCDESIINEKSLSLTTTSSLSEDGDATTIGRVCFQLHNHGDRQGRYILLAFLSPPPSSPINGAPLRSLRAFGSIDLAPGATAIAEMALTVDDVSLADEEGQFKMIEGEWTLTSTEDSQVELKITV